MFFSIWDLKKLQIYTKFRKRTKISCMAATFKHFSWEFIFLSSFEHQVKELTTVIFIRHAIVVNGSRSSIYNRRVNLWCRTADSSPENFVSLLLPFNTIGSEVGIMQGTVLATLKFITMCFSTGHGAGICCIIMRIPQGTVLVFELSKMTIIPFQVDKICYI